MEHISEWDADYVQNVVVPHVEVADLEKKASDKFKINTSGKLEGGSREELAKQVCGFANSGTGFLVYGIRDDNTLDAGVASTVGRQSTKDWIEAAIPTLIYPSLTTCEARCITIPNHHQPGRCVLVVSTPLSERRPHWVTSPSEIAYIRAGAHTYPMRPQSLLDIASREGGSSAEVEARLCYEPNINGSTFIIHLYLFVRLVSGRLCEKWSLDITSVAPNVELGSQMIETGSPIRVSNKKQISVVSGEPLFSGRDTPVPMGQLKVIWQQGSGEVGLEAKLHLDSGFNSTTKFTLADLSPVLGSLAKI